ncbi:hypothetical protein HMPREF0621_0024 [Pasteurella dagmatis ATCC 43325]|uniref:Uncharacterized protein n=1 Tax=Pasteurella dagmatis ATCC 43325 TaxID=667128 RepID=C9PM00_9PAST|nr:hypothetical protein HMPREF0621_0024 [Pasteurella dagmatis ATCC 43325]
MKEIAIPKASVNKPILRFAIAEEATIGKIGKTQGDRVVSNPANKLNPKTVILMSILFPVYLLW